MNFEILKKTDSEIADAIAKEFDRQKNTLELIASENIVSRAVMAAHGTVLTNKYAEGYPGKRYYGGCEYVDVVENIAIERAKKLFGADYANVQPHSGSQANMAVYSAFLNPGDTILAMELSHGGHLSHGSPVSFSGKLYNFVHYGVKKETGTIDYEGVGHLAEKHRPKLIVAGASTYSRFIDFEAFSRIAKSVGAVFMVDMAHIAGLVAAGIHPSPVPFADVVTSTTHKTLRGPRGGLILAGSDFTAKLNKEIFPGIQGGPLMHVIAAKAVAFKEASTESFKVYQTNIVKNAKAFAEKLMTEGIKLVSGGTDTHVMLLDLTNLGLTGKEAEEVLGRADITVNKNTIPFETRSPFVTSGIRIGTSALTTRAMRETEMSVIAGLVADVLKQPSDEGLITRVRKKVRELCEEFPFFPDTEKEV